MQHVMVVSEVASLLRDHSGVKVNWANDNQWTALHYASWKGHVEVVKLLLAHPDINVNLKTRQGQTPFSLGCENGQVFVVRVLLNDPRVNITLADRDGCTPLWWASWKGHHEVIEWLIASGRDLGEVKNKKGTDRDNCNEYTALEIARTNKKTEVVSLLERFMVNPAQTRHSLDSWMRWLLKSMP